jgi:hypothetical protein
MAIWQFWMLIGVLVAIFLAIIKVNDTIGVNGVYLGTIHDTIKGIHNMLDEISRKVSQVESIAADVRNNTVNQ